MKIYQAGITDTGEKRELNEDHFVIDNDLGCVIVADGMGGHEAGEVASKEASRIIHEHLKSAKKNYSAYVSDVVAGNVENNKTWNNLPNPLLSVVEEAVRLANSTINKINKDNGFSDNQGMGTTVVGIWILEQVEEAVLFHVGDSRLYLLRNKSFGQISVDHSLYQLWLDNGQIGPEPPKNIILSGVGLRETVEMSSRLLAIQPGDVFLLCSDGLSDLVDENEIAESLKKATFLSLNEVCTELIEKANKAGGTDNITVSLSMLGE